VIAIAAPSPHGRANRRHIVAMRAHLSAVVAKVIDAASRCAKNGSPARDPAHDRAEGPRWPALILAPFLGWIGCNGFSRVLLPRLANAGCRKFVIT
jgi:hypothetical protein